MKAMLFIKKYITNPRTIGSLVPSSKSLGKNIYEIIKTLEKCKVIEIGAGTGAITDILLPINPLVIEIDMEFSNLLKQKYPHLEIINTCAIDYIRNIFLTAASSTQFGLVMSIPLINNPFKHSFVKELNNLYRSGLLKWCITYTYGLQSPLKAVKFAHESKRKTVLNNFPPANIWVYS